MMACHWGEMPVVQETDDSGIAAIELEQMTKPRPMDIQGPDIYQPPNSIYPESFPGSSFEIDGMTKHTISLVHYSKRMKMQIQSMQHQKEHMGEGDADMDYVPAQAVPPCSDGCAMKHAIPTTIPFLPNEPKSDFARGIGEPPVSLDQTSTRLLLKRSVAAICAHTGYENCSNSILDTLTDITQEYFVRMTKLMRSALDSEARDGDQGYEDIMEQVFQEIGIGSTTNLHEFYTTRIVNYHNNMIALCRQLYRDYESLRIGPLRPVAKIKQEPICVKQEADSFEIADEDNEYTDNVSNIAAATGFNTSLEDELTDDDHKIKKRKETTFSMKREPEPHHSEEESLSSDDSASNPLPPQHCIPHHPPLKKRSK